MEHDFFTLFSRFWWIIFPLFWMAYAMVRLWLRHSRANRTLDILKSYAEQGKEPPAEVLTALKDRHDLDAHRHSGPEHGWRHFYLFAGLAVAFGVVAFVPNEMSEGHELAFVFVAIIMVGLALGGLVSALMKPRSDVRQRDRLQ
jgi:hypothetical protein